MTKRTIWSISTTSKVIVGPNSSIVVVVVTAIVVVVVAAVVIVLTPLPQLTSPKLKIHFQSRCKTYFEQISFFCNRIKKVPFTFARFNLKVPFLRNALKENLI